MTTVQPERSIRLGHCGGATRIQRVGIGVLIALALALLPTHALAQSNRATTESVDAQMRAFKATLGNLEGAVARLTREYKNPVAIVKTHPMERRLIEARIAVELGNFESASILLTDLLVDTPAFKTSTDYYPAAMWLAESLMALDNPRGAQGWLEIIASGNDRTLAEQARAHLIDMALRDDDDIALRAVVERVSSATEPRTRYGVGKAWLRLGDHDQARSVLAGIPAASPFNLRAKYYLGVVDTATGNHAAALTRFQELARLAPSDETEKRVRDLSLLAAGRLLLELGDLDAAVTSYQRIERTSPHYGVALYEMAFAYIKREQYDRALQTVDIMLLVVDDPQLEVEGYVLRGRLNIFMEAYDDAVDSYEQIVERFAPIRNELERFTEDPANIQRYFTWLLERNSSDKQLTAPLTARTAAWVASSDDMGRVGDVFALLAGEQAELEAVEELARDLERIVTSDNRVELFPELQQGWTRALAVETQLIMLSSAILDSQYARARGYVVGKSREELDSMIVWRHRLEERLGDLPRTFEQYQKRKADVDERFLDLERKSFLVGQNLKEIKRQFLALETYFKDLQFSDEGERMKPEREALLKGEIEIERARLQTLLAELDDLQKTIQIEAAAVGTGDGMTVSEGNLKGTLIESHKREGLLYTRLGDGPLASTGAATGLSGYRERIWQSVDRLGGVIAAIDQNVGLKADELRRGVADEHAKIVGYGVTLRDAQSESQAIARGMGDSLFEQARARMSAVVLDADVGLIDVAWEQKRTRTEEIRKVNLERAKKLQKLDEDLKILLGSGSGGAL